MAGHWDTITVDGGSMRCYVTMPGGAGPHPAVVVIQPPAASTTSSAR
jgi:dienelactone hydrolase